MARADPIPMRRRRIALAEWVTAKDNPFFAKSTVNRVWSYFFGRGIIDPVDDIRASNPPSNPAVARCADEGLPRPWLRSCAT